jgi:hypothetical protein
MAKHQSWGGNERRSESDYSRLFELIERGNKECKDGQESINLKLTETNTNMAHIQEGFRDLKALGSANQILLAKHDVRIDEAETDAINQYKMIGEDRKVLNSLKIKPQSKHANPLVEVVTSNNFVYVLGLAAFALMLVALGLLTSDEIKAIGELSGQ